MAQTQDQARQFFVDKLLHQATVETVSLSGDERQMLLWPGSEADSVSDAALATRLAASISEADYESKIAGLLFRSFAEDVSRNSSGKKQWRDARATLRNGDYYILVIIDQAVGRQLGTWWKFW